MLSSIGLPGLNGFVGEFLILLGTFTANRWWAVIAATGVILAALYLLWAYQRVFHGPQNQEDEPTKDLTNWERLTLLPLIVAIVFWVSTLNQCLTASNPLLTNLFSTSKQQLKTDRSQNQFRLLKTEHPSAIY